MAPSSPSSRHSDRPSRQPRLATLAALAVAVAAVAVACESGHVQRASTGASTHTGAPPDTSGAAGAGGAGDAGGAAPGAGGAAGACDGCECEPGAVEPCYVGPAGTEGIGTCHAGQRTCEGDGWFGPCIGAVVPALADGCGVDATCDGRIVVADEDGDGWTVCDGDCCDSELDCKSPKGVNPGAIEEPSNGVDDDCDPTTPEDAAPALCDLAVLSPPTAAMDLLRAMDLCRTADAAAPLPSKTWGVVSAELLLADGTPAPSDLQAGVLAAYGPFVSPKKGATMAALSTGTARAEGDTGHVYPQDGPWPGDVGSYDAQTTVQAPADYLAAHGGTLPDPELCPACVGPECTLAHDSVMLRAFIRVPTNRDSFRFWFKFYSAELPERGCQPSPDRFVALVTTSRPFGAPPDKNVARSSLFGLTFDGPATSVNDLVFPVCFFSDGMPAGACTGGTLDLFGTGMGGWDGALDDGVATEWRKSDNPSLVPGETIELDFVVWDGTDHGADSLVLLDGFRWETLFIAEHP